MALSEVTVTFNLHSLLGGDFDARRTKAYVTTNVANGTLMDTSTGETRIGDEAVTIASDGTGSFTTWAPGADGNPTSWQTSLVVDYPRLGQRDRKTRTFGPYTITADADLTELEEEQAVPPEYATELLATLTALHDETEGFRDDARTISEIDETTFARIGAVDHGDTTGALTVDATLYALHEVTLTGDVTLTPAGRLGDNMAVRVVQDATGGHTLTLDGVEMPEGWSMSEDPDAEELITLLRWVTGWRGYVATPGIPVTPAAPTFTDLDGSGSDTYTIPATTGVIYKVNGVETAAGTYPATGAVTITAQATLGYSLSGTSSWAHTFSTAGWATLATDTFTGADATALTSHAASNGQTWTSPGTSATIQTNAAQFSTHGGGSENRLSLVTTHTAGVRISGDYDFTVESAGSVGYIGLSLNFTSTYYGNAQYAGVELNKNGGLAEQMVGVDTLGLTGTLTGHPASGNIALEILGTAVKVYINDVQVATGTLPGALLGSTARLTFFNRYPRLDNLLVETYSA